MQDIWKELKSDSRTKLHSNTTTLRVQTGGSPAQGTAPPASKQAVSFIINQHTSGQRTRYLGNAPSWLEPFASKLLKRNLLNAYDPSRNVINKKSNFSLNLLYLHCLMLMSSFRAWLPVFWKCTACYISLIILYFILTETHLLQEFSALRVVVLFWEYFGQFLVSPHCLPVKWPKQWVGLQ